MKKSLFCVACLMLLCFLQTGCDKIDDNGDFGGFWQLKEWKVLPSGEIKATKESGIFYSVQLNLIKFSSNNEKDNIFFARFSRKGDILQIGTVYERPKDEEVGLEKLSVFGVPLDGRFKIEHLSASSMILSCADARMTFRKY